MSMMKTSLLLILLLVSLVVPNASATGLRSRTLQQCQDTEDKFMLFQSGTKYKKRNCNYVSKNLNRCTKKLENDAGLGRDMCPDTCGLCPCEDTTDKFSLHSKKKGDGTDVYKMRNCAFIAKNVKKQCKKKLEDGSGKGKDMCPVTCGNCPEKDDAEESEVAAPVNTKKPTARPSLPPKEPEVEAEAKPTREPVHTCFDYSQYDVLNIGTKECTWWFIFNHIHALYKEQDALDDTPRCEDGFWNEVRRLTGTVGTEGEEWKKALDALCQQALYEDAVDEVPTATWDGIEDAGINLEEFFNGEGFMNTDTGNFQQSTEEFERRGGYDRWAYIGDDPTLNDYLPTPQRSINGGQAVRDLYDTKLSDQFLSTPAYSKLDSGCPATKAAVCCWSRDRQYNDNNGSCHGNGNCRNGKPGDNTDLCWTTDDADNTIYPYPTQDTEDSLHCHGYSWSDGDFSETTQHNNLFFVSLYDHLYKRGYAQSITDNPNIRGNEEVPMCGCVEDMHVVARADCTEIVPRTNYTAFQDPDTGYIVVEPKRGTFELEYNACEGYKYNPDVSPAAYAENPNAHEQGLHRQTNDLSAKIFRQYLEGKKDLQETKAFEKTIIGYKDPEVNNGDTEREAACKKAFEAKYPGQPWEVKEEKCKQVKGAPKMEKGYCVTADDQDQNAGVTKLSKKNFTTCEDFAECLALCQAVEGATGCEVIWNHGNLGCDVHTEPIAKGNGKENTMCWVF